MFTRVPSSQNSASGESRLRQPEPAAPETTSTSELFHRVQHQPTLLRENQVLQLQRTIGNRAVQHLLRHAPFPPRSLQRFEDDEIQLPARLEWEEAGEKKNQSEEESQKDWNNGILRIIAHYIGAYKQGGGQTLNQKPQPEDYQAARTIWEHAQSKGIDIKWITKSQIERIFTGKAIDAGTAAMILELNGEHYEMLVKLKEAASLSPEYTQFCDLIFSKPDIMETKPGKMQKKGLDELIYDQYTDRNDRGNQITTYEESFDYWAAIETAVPGAFGLQFAGKTLAAVGMKRASYLKSVRHKDQDRIATIQSYMRDFVYCMVDNSLDAVYRVYANIAKTAVAGAAQTLIGQPGVRSFKFAGPLDIGKRADGLVVYCDSRDTAETIGSLLNTTVKVLPGAPGMTEQVDGNSGLGIGAEPDQVSTGMRGQSNLEEYGPDAQSFGMIRSELIASAVLHYQNNQELAKALNIEPLELFKRFVGLAVSGWSESLEPTQ